MNGTHQTLDGSALTLSGFDQFTARFNYLAQVQLDNSIHAFNYELGTTLNDYRKMRLPDSYRIRSEVEYGMQGGTLGVAHLEITSAEFGPRSLVWVGWQGATGLLRTSVSATADYAVGIALFDQLKFVENDAGVVVENPIDETRRPVQLLLSTEILGTVTVSPRRPGAIQSLIPTNGGLRTSAGELYELENLHKALLLVTPNSVTQFQNRMDTTAPRSLQIQTARSVGVDWSARSLVTS